MTDTTNKADEVLRDHMIETFASFDPAEDETLNPVANGLIRKLACEIRGHRARIRGTTNASDVAPHDYLQDVADYHGNPYIRGICKELLAYRARNKEKADESDVVPDSLVRFLQVGRGIVQMHHDDARKIGLELERHRARDKEKADVSVTFDLSSVIDNQSLEKWAKWRPGAEAPFTTLGSKTLANLSSELLTHRAAERKRAEETLPISRERLEWLCLSGEAREGKSAPLDADGIDSWAATSVEEQALARFVRAHLPVKVKMTEVAEPLVEHHATVAISTKQLADHARDVHELRETLLTLVKTSSERDTVRLAALALIGTS